MLTKGRTEEREQIIARMEEGDLTPCAAYAYWMRSAYRELDENQETATIHNVEHGFKASSTDAGQIECPCCIDGYVLRREATYSDR